MTSSSLGTDEPGPYTEAMSSKKPLSEEDLALFRDAVGEVRAVADDRVHDVPRRRPPAVARSAEKG